MGSGGNSRNVNRGDTLPASTSKPFRTERRRCPIPKQNLSNPNSSICRARSLKTMESVKVNVEGGENISEEQAKSQLNSLSKRAQKKLLKQQIYEARKAEKKAKVKEEKKREGERKRKEWELKLASLSEEERSELIEERKRQRKERMEKRSEERENKIQRLTKAKESGQNIVIDLEFSDLMTSTEIHSLVQQVYLFTSCL